MNPRIRKILLLSVLGIVVLAGGAQGIQYMWRHGFSNGERTGVVRKISVKGTPVCKVLAGEMVLQGSGITVGGGEVWEFTVDDHSDDNPIVKSLHEAAREGKRVTLKYRQDKPMWWTCNPVEYKVTEVLQ